MPRAGQVKPPADERLSDRIAIGLLTATFPPELVDRVVAETGRVQQRSRLLPARVVVYYVLAMCLFFGQGYEEVARLLTEGLAYARRWRGHFPTEQAALKCLYLAIMSLDPSGRGRKRWTNRWKAALNAFDLTFDGRLTAGRR